MRELPGGLVTFLFTDIEGSTKLLRELGREAYADALDQHRRVVRDAVSLHDGVVVNAEGDAFFVAFPTADGALAAAVKTQEALAHGPIKVRIGIHTGEALARNGKYVGLDVHRAARIADAGHGGQVLVSQAARDAAERAVALRHLGEYRLKDLAASERLYQLGGGNFPRLRSLNETNLPALLEPMLGRKKELSDVLRFVRRERVRLLSITGPGGIGKTRFAAGVGMDLLESFPHGVWFVDLSAVRDATLVMRTIATTLGGPEDVSEQIRDREILLILDNFEQAIDAAGELCGLLGRCPRLCLLVTSRERLRVSGERAYPLRPLSEASAVELFHRRAIAVQPDFEADYEELVDLCRRLDGLPLAVELAAARVSVLPLDRLAERLDRRLALLTGGARDLPERQRTMRSVIDWSYQLLTEDEQDLFMRLAVFAGGFSLEAAEGVCECTLDDLAALVDKSLLRARGGRFAMLETIREYAAELLDTLGPRDEASRRHADFFLRLARKTGPELQGADQVRCLASLEREQANIRAALIWSLEHDPGKALRAAGAVWRWWYICGHWEEGERLLVHALEQSPGAPPEDRAAALSGAGSIARNRGQNDLALERLLASVSLLRQIGDSRGIAVASNNLANVLFGSGDVAGAKGLYEESLALQRANGLNFGIPGVLANLGLIAVVEGDDVRARERYEEALEIARANGNQASVAVAAVNLGSVALRARDDAAAQRWFVESLSIFQGIGMTEGIANALDGFSGVALDRHDFERGTRLISAGDRLRDSIGASLAAWDQPEFDRRVETARQALGEDVFNRAWTEGQELAMEDLVEDALTIPAGAAVSIERTDSATC